MLPAPDVPDAQRGTGTYSIRFEDVTQDGRLHFAPLVASLGASLWAPILSRDPVSAALRADGVRPVFTRVEVEGGSARMDLAVPLTATGRYELAHDRGPDGAVTRLYLNMWTEVWGTSAGERAFAGRLFAEHVLTRPLAPPERRRVVAVQGLVLPSARYRSPSPEEIVALPEGAAWIEPAMHVDPTSTAFGIAHTDINQHVNSLVYPRLFEESALRRFSSLGKSTRVLSRALVISFRKPFFAGQTAKVILRAYEKGGALGAAGAFIDEDGEAEAKPHAHVRMELVA